MLSAESHEHGKRNAFLKVYLVETVIYQGYKPYIFQVSILPSNELLVSKGKKPRLKRPQTVLA